MTQFTKQEKRDIFNQAWKITETAQFFHGGTKKQYFSEALKEAYKMASEIKQAQENSEFKTGKYDFYLALADKAEKYQMRTVSLFMNTRTDSQIYQAANANNYELREKAYRVLMPELEIKPFSQYDRMEFKKAYTAICHDEDCYYSDLELDIAQACARILVTCIGYIDSHNRMLQTRI